MIFKNYPANFENENQVIEYAEKCVKLCQEDWGFFELSWDFEIHPLIRYNNLSDAYNEWKNECKSVLNSFKMNEEELNRILLRFMVYRMNCYRRLTIKLYRFVQLTLQRDIKSPLFVMLLAAVWSLFSGC